MLGMSMSLNDNVLNKPYPPNSITRRRRRRACRTSSSCGSGPSNITSSKELPRRIKLKLFTSFTSLRQRSCGIYDCMLEYCDHEHKHVHTWLQRAKARNHANRGYQDRLAAFERHMRVLANEGIAYDPRTPGAQLPLNTRHAQLAEDARHAWKELRTVEDEAERFDRILEDAANSQRRAWESLKAKLEIAHGQHVLHMSPRLTSRKAIERWLRAGKLTMYGQWILRALGTPTPPPTK